VARREPEAARLAARLIILYRTDPAQARLLARLAELHLELRLRLQMLEEQAVTDASDAERVTGSRPDPTEVVAAQAARLANAAGRLRRQRKNRTEQTRRLINAYEVDLNLRDPPRGHSTTLASGRQVPAVEWVDSAGHRQVEGHRPEGRPRTPRGR
jgi:hypothetical protein